MPLVVATCGIFFNKNYLILSIHATLAPFRLTASLNLKTQLCF